MRKIHFAAKGRMKVEAYTTLKGQASDVFIERRSRFIGSACPVESEAAALAFISEKRKTYWDANHHVFAYILREGQIKRCSDDGEPQGTAGVPVLEVLQQEGLSDLVVVATRYFGGVLLGAGGLVRAYSHTAKLAIDAAGRKQMEMCVVLEIELGYDFYGKLTRLLQNYQTKSLDIDFGAEVRLEVLVREEDHAAFCDALIELFAARVIPRLIERRFAAFP